MSDRFPWWALAPVAILAGGAVLIGVKNGWADPEPPTHLNLGCIDAPGSSFDPDGHKVVCQDSEGNRIQLNFGYNPFDRSDS